MRGIHYALVAIPVLVLGVLYYRQGSKQNPKQSFDSPSAATQDVDTFPEDLTAPEIPEATSAPIVAGRDEGIDAGSVVVDGEALVRQLHVLEGTNPGLAASLARQDRQRSPNGPHAEERDMVLVAALHNHRDFDGARREAWYYFMRYPNGKFTDYLSRLTGIDPAAIRPSR